MDIQKHVKQGRRQRDAPTCGHAECAQSMRGMRGVRAHMCARVCVCDGTTNTRSSAGLVPCRPPWPQRRLNLSGSATHRRRSRPATEDSKCLGPESKRERGKDEKMERERGGERERKKERYRERGRGRVREGERERGRWGYCIRIGGYVSPRSAPRPLLIRSH